MRNERNDCQQQQDEDVIWNTLLSSIIALITTALMVLQQVGKKAGGRFCKANFDFSSTILKLTQLNSKTGECCLCKSKIGDSNNRDNNQNYEEEYMIKQQRQQNLQALPPPRSKPHKESQTDIELTKGSQKACCDCSFLNNTTVDSESPYKEVKKSELFAKAVEEDDDTMIISSLPLPQAELTTEPLISQETQTLTVEIATTGVQFDKELSIDKGENTEPVQQTNQAICTDVIETKQQEVQICPSKKAVCSQKSCPNNTTMGTQKTETYSEPSVTCEVLETLTVCPTDFYQTNARFGRGNEYYDTEDDYDDEYEEYAEEAPVYMAAPRSAYRTEAHCIRGNQIAKACPETCQVTSTMRRPAMPPQYASSAYAKKYKQQGLSEAMRAKVRFPPPIPSSYGVGAGAAATAAYRRPVSTYSPSNLASSSYQGRGVVSKIPCPYVESKLQAKPKASQVRTPESQSQELDKCSCLTTSSMSNNV